MTIEFFKTKRGALMGASDYNKMGKAVATRMGIAKGRVVRVYSFKPVRVKVMSARELNNAGFRLQDKPTRQPKNGECGYVLVSKYGRRQYELGWIERSGMKRAVR